MFQGTDIVAGLLKQVGRHQRSAPRAAVAVDNRVLHEILGEFLHVAPRFQLAERRQPGILQSPFFPFLEFTHIQEHGLLFGQVRLHRRDRVFRMVGGLSRAAPAVDDQRLNHQDCQYHETALPHQE